MKSCRLVVVVIVAALAANLRARADDAAGERVRVDYAAPSDCPDRARFETALAEHLGTATFARLDELARTLTVAIEPDPEGFRARVELVDRQGHATERSITAPTCAQAMQAIALVAALAARSQAEAIDRERSAAAASAGVIAEPPPLPAPTSAPTSPPPPKPVAPPPKEPRAEPVGAVFAASGGIVVSTGVGPRVAPGILAAGRAGLRGDPERSLVLSLLAQDTFRSSLEQAEVRFTLLKARLELCPLEPRLSNGLVASPCAGFELGSQTGRSYGDERVENSGSASLLWAAATAALRLRYSAGPLELGVGPELSVPFTRNRFALSGPERPVYTVPPVTVGGAASLGYAW